MKIAIVNPPYNYGNRFGIRAGSRWPFTGTTPNYFYCPYPMWMGYATSYLASKGHEVLFYDAVGRRQHNYDKFYHEVASFEPEFVLQEISYPSLNIDLEVAKRMAQFSLVVLCGTHASVAAEELAALPFIHAVFRGPYEEHALDLVNTGRTGVYDYRPLENLDKYPWPHRSHSIKCDARTNFTAHTGAYTMYYDPCCGNMPEPMLSITMSRGCPFKCNFCLWPNTMYRNQIVWRDVDKVLEEIEYFAQHDYRSVYFDDDTQNACGWERMKQLCDGMKEIGIPWLMLGRLDLNSLKEFQYMIDHGCAGMRLGVESVSQKQLDRMNKKLKVDDIKKKIDYLKSRTNLYLLFMHGFPGETEEEKQDTVNYINEVNAPSQNPICIPFPGTPYYDKIAQQIPQIRNCDPIEFDGNNLSTNLVNLVKQYKPEREDNV
jgi:anaerobic magnesium-protoporphyrin IX monomethyl ester cyclase